MAGRALCTYGRANTTLRRREKGFCPATAPVMLRSCEACRNGESHGRVGAVCLGMGFDSHPLAACDGGDRVDRRLVLLHASRRLAAQTRRHAGRRLRRVVAGARRRLLRNEQIYARPAVAARRPHLAQMAVLLDLDLRLHPAVLGLLRPVELFPDRPRRAGAEPVAGGVDRRRLAGAGVGRLRRDLQIAAREKRCDPARRRIRLRRADVLGLQPRFLIARRVDPHRRADGDDDDGQCRDGHHAQPAQGDRAVSGRAKPGPEMGQAGQAALDAQQLHHAARAVHDAVEPLSPRSTPTRE